MFATKQVRKQANKTLRRMQVKQLQNKQANSRILATKKGRKRTKLQEFHQECHQQRKLDSQQTKTRKQINGKSSKKQGSRASYTTNESKQHKLGKQAIRMVAKQARKLQECV